MALRILSGRVPDDGEEPWTHWNQDAMGDWRANFYNTTEPYMRKPYAVTGIGPDLGERLESMKAEVDARAAADGLVTFDKLPEAIQRYWAESDAARLAADIIRHVEERHA